MRPLFSLCLSAERRFNEMVYWRLYFAGKVHKKVNFEDIGADGKIILKLVSKKLGWWCVDWGFCDMWLKFSTFVWGKKKNPVIESCSFWWVQQNGFYNFPFSFRIRRHNLSLKHSGFLPRDCVQYPKFESRLCCWLPCSRFSEWCWWGFGSVGLTRGLDISSEFSSAWRTKGSLLYLNIQSVPRSKHSVSRLCKLVTECRVGKWPLFVLRSTRNK
jgi:hypothetical protein